MSIEQDIDKRLAEVRKVFLERHAKYGAKNIANSPGGPLNGLRVRMHDKQARISNYVDNGGKADYADDALRDAFVDMVGYGLIGLLVLDGDWPSGSENTPTRCACINGQNHCPHEAQPAERYCGSCIRYCGRQS